MRRRKEGISIPMKYKANTDYQTIPDSLKPNAIALYTTRPQGLSDFEVNMTNAVTNGRFANTTGWNTTAGVLTVADNTGILTGNGSGATIYISDISTRVSGRKYFGVTRFRVTNSVCTRLRLVVAGVGIVDVNNPTENEWYYRYVIGGAGADGTTTISVQHTYADAATANGKAMEVQEAMCSDLTTTFGLSNEPTASEFNDMLTYKGKTFWNGTEPVIINPNDKYYWPDRSGSNRHIHLVNMAYDATGGLQAGPPANMLFDGVNDYGVYNSPTDIVAANGAVSAFVVFQAKDAVAATHRTAAIGSSTKTMLAALAAFSSTTTIHTTSDDLTSGNSVSNSGVSTLPNKWYSVASIYDPSVKKPSVSANGGNVVLGTALINGTASANKIILASNVVLSAFNNDRIAEVYFFNKVLTQAEIKSLHNNIASRYGLTKV